MEVFSVIGYFSDLRYKEVIDIHSGYRLGYVFDAEVDQAEGRVLSLITPGRAKLFGLLGREDDYVLPWTSIVRIGTDIILVDLQESCQRRKRPRRGLWQ
jgi:YlmC/YmxH family sporulation protein